MKLFQKRPNGNPDFINWKVKLKPLRRFALLFSIFRFLQAFASPRSRGPGHAWRRISGWSTPCRSAYTRKRSCSQFLAGYLFLKKRKTYGYFFYSRKSFMFFMEKSSLNAVFHMFFFASRYPSSAKQYLTSTLDAIIGLYVNNRETNGTPDTISWSSCVPRHPNWESLH